MISTFFSSHIFIGISTSEKIINVPLLLMVFLLSLVILGCFFMFYKLRNLVRQEREDKLVYKVKIEDMERQCIALSTIYKSIPDMIFCKNTNSIYTSCNWAFENFVGCSEEEIIGKSDMEIFKANEEMTRLFVEADKKVLRDENVEVIEEWVPFPGGTQGILLETLKTPMYHNNQVIGLMGIGRDITARKKIEEDAQLASKSKTAFLSQMSHEIRTPLNAIIGMSNIALLSINNTEKAKTSIRQVISSSQHLLGILNDILDISKIESGKMQLAPDSNNLIVAYEEVNCIIKDRCDEKGIHYIHNLDTLSNLQLLFDKLRLTQVLINLLGNAVKFTQSKGTVELSIDIVEETDETATLLFSITDNGIGMTEAQIEKLFIPFEQTDSSISARFGGTGLGLAISQRLILMMGGKITAESTLEVKTVFRFTLTFEKKCVVMSPSIPLETEKFPNLEGLRILLAEDVEVNRIIVKEVLSLTKVEIVEAVDGKEALEIFQTSGDNYFSLIFMDVQMPKMDGYEATRQIRSLRGSYAQNVPIIAMTAHAYKEDVDAALESGMNAHLPKPLDFNQLNQLLTRYQAEGMLDTP